MEHQKIEIEITLSCPKYGAINIKLSKAAWVAQAFKLLVGTSIAIGFALANGGAILQNPTVKAILPMLKGEQQR